MRLREAFYDKNKEIRKTVSSVMSMIMVRGGFNVWPDLLQFLTDNLKLENLSQIHTLANTEHSSIIENSILSISIIVEDCSELFGEEKYMELIAYMLEPVFNLLKQN